MLELIILNPILVSYVDNRLCQIYDNYFLFKYDLNSKALVSMKIEVMSFYVNSVEHQISVSSMHMTTNAYCNQMLLV